MKNILPVIDIFLNKFGLGKEVNSDLTFKIRVHLSGEPGPAAILKQL